MEVKFKHQDYPVLIYPTFVEELTSIQITDNGINFGASVTLSTIEDVLREEIKQFPGKLINFLDY